jgi:hypothetical protein
MSSQGAGSNGGQAAGRQFVSFTRSAAQRIAKVVRTVEAGNRTQPGVEYDHPIYGGGQAAIRSATFTGSWDIGSPKTVSFKYITGTANATNDLMNLPANGTRNCVIGREGTAWRLMNWQWDVAYAATAATLTTSSLTFQTLPFAVVGTSSTVTFSISATACTAS